MSYNTRFFFRFESDAGREFRINIKQDGFSGTAVQRPLGASPTLRRDDAENGIRGTSLEIIAECDTENEFAALYTSDARKFYVELIDVSGNAVLWDGFVSPELYAAPEIAPPYDVQITVVDGLGELKRQKFPGGGRKSILAHLQTILSYSGLGVGNADFVIIDSLHCTEPSVSAAGLLGSIYTDLDHFVEEDLNCYDALEAILRTLNLTITRISGKRWLLMRESDVEVASGSVAAKTASGTSVSLPVPKYGSMVSSQWWPVGNMANEIEPAKKQLATALAYVMRNSMLNDGDMNDSTAWTSQRVTFQDGFAKMSGDSINRLPATLSQSISVSQYDSPLRLIIAAQHSVPIIMPGDVDVKAYIKIKLESSGTTQYLQKSAGENLSWTTREKDFQFVVPLTLNGSGTTEFAWSIPNIPADGTLTLEIKVPYYGSAPYHVWVDYIHLLQTAPFGYMDTVIIDNDARGKLDESILAFGDSPYVANALRNLKNIVSTSNNTLVEEWATAQFEGVLLSVMAMDRALAVALPRLWAKGTLHVPDAATLPFAIESPEDLPMIVRRASWNLIDDEIDVDLLSIPSADVEIDTETIAPMTESQAAEAGGSGGGSGSGGSGGGSSSGGALYEYFEDVENSDGERTGIKSIYDLFITQTPADEEEEIPEVKKNISSILRHFSEVILDEGEETERTVLVCDISLGSELAVFAGGIGEPGGGGGGGSLATLNDVALSNLADGQILRYNALTSHWVNETLTLALSALTDVNLGTPTNGQVLKYSSATQKWVAADDAGGIASVGLTMPTGFTVTGSPLTADGTIAVSFTSGYGLVTDAERSNFHSHSNKSVLDDITSTDVSHWGTAYTNNHTHSNKSTLDGISASDITHWNSAYNNIGYADYNSSAKALATQEWVTGRGYITSAVTSLNSLTGGVTLAEGSNISISKSGSTITIANTYSYTHPTDGANTTITAANGKVLSAITVDSYGHTTSVSSKTLAAADIPDLSGSYLPLSGGVLTGDLYMRGGNYGRSIFFGDGSYVYLNEDSDDHLKIYADKGIALLTKSATYPLVIGTSSTALPVTLYGSTSAGLTIYGGSSYSTAIYRNSSALQVGSNLAVSGNITASGAITAGSASDRRLKDDIRPISLVEAADLLSVLNPVTFRWNEKAGEMGQLKGVSRGFIADEFLSLVPNAGRKIWGDYDAIDYNQVIPYLVAGWQQQNLRIRILEGDISTLREENALLRRRLKEANVLH